jgi:transposase
MDRQTLRDWAHRFNAEVPAGLRNAPQGRPARRLTAAQEAEIRARVLAGPDPQKDGLARWRCVDVQTWIAETYHVQYHVRSVGKLLHKLPLSHVSVRPVHPESSAEAQENYKKTSPPK